MDEAATVDWDKGLTPDILALVAKAGGREVFEVMRGVSRTWKTGADLTVLGILMKTRDKIALPADGPTRFPAVRRLEIGRSSWGEADMASLAGFQQLTSLNLGENWVFEAGFEDCLGGRITGAGFVHLQGMPLQHLCLSQCRGLDTLEHLRGLPITNLDLAMDRTLAFPPALGKRSFALTNGSLVALVDMPLAHLKLCDWENLTGEGMQFVRGLPLTDLELQGCASLTAGDLEALRGLPLKKLDLKRCDSMSDAGLACLQGMPLEMLKLEGCEWVSDEAFQFLKGLPLTDLVLDGCVGFTGSGFWELRGMRIKHIDLSLTERFDGNILRHLAEIHSMEYICVSNCGWFRRKHARYLEEINIEYQV